MINLDEDNDDNDELILLLGAWFVLTEPIPSRTSRLSELHLILKTVSVHLMGLIYQQLFLLKIKNLFGTEKENISECFGCG
jgi:hypothetical protein